MQLATHPLLARLLIAGKWVARRFSFDSLVMYMIAIVSEIPVMFIRGLLVWFTASIALLILKDPAGDVAFFTELTMLPVYLSMLALITPIGTGWFFKARTGGREPSDREKLAYQDAIDQLQSQSPTPLPLPRSWFVVDTLQANAAVCGNTLLICRATLESEYLPAVIAHELGHLQSPDGRLTEALNRLIIWHPRSPEERESPPLKILPRQVHFELALNPFSLALLALKIIWWLFLSAIPLSNGGLGLWLTRGLWGVYWREREYAADHYAATLGQAEELADSLEQGLIYDHPVPFIWLTEHTHPPTELRIDRLRKYAEKQHEATIKLATNPTTEPGPLAA